MTEQFHLYQFQSFLVHPVTVIMHYCENLPTLPPESTENTPCGTGSCPVRVKNYWGWQWELGTNICTHLKGP